MAQANARRKRTLPQRAASKGENRVQPIKFGHVNICLIRAERGHILVDAGMPNSEEKLDSAFREAGADPESVELIITTHGHLDHKDGASTTAAKGDSQ